ncbi:hypothetical protein IFM89_026511 [Coptis chinensis]|uniref:Uncharacterized protein n=1 Tax=Coptis chinensis TaxID=261450 RepID=A0A835HBN9_9MAGN|nr:hypothetical protein IFM89_026511 [Coptis chinensis]
MEALTQTFSLEAKTYDDVLSAIGEQVKNTYLVNAILCGVGSEYEMLVIALESLETLPQFSALRYRLLNYESRHRSSPPLGPLALLASHATSQNSYKGAFHNAAQVPDSLHSTFAGLQIAPPALPQPYYSRSPSSYTAQQSYDLAYYLDTGASIHMIGDPAYLHQRTPYTGPDSVLLGNSDKLPITYTGNIYGTSYWFLSVSS